jgi:Cu/Ag efflux protein CusF
MRTQITFALACALAALAGAPAPAQTNINPETTSPRMVFSETNHFRGTVESINHLTRKITLKRPDGSTFKVAVGDDVKNFSHIKKGDDVDAVYYQSVALALGKPGETLAPTSTSEMLIRRGPGQKPGGVAMTVTDVSATVQDVDRENREVTLKEADGDVVKVKVDPSVGNLEQIKKGDQITASRTEALAVSVEAPGEKQ